MISVFCLGNCLHCWCISGYSMLTLSQVPCLVLYWVLWSTWLIFEQGNKYRSICSPTPFLVRPAPFIKNAFLDFQHVFLFFYQKIKKNSSLVLYILRAVSPLPSSIFSSPTMKNPPTDSYISWAVQVSVCWMLWTTVCSENLLHSSYFLMFFSFHWWWLCT